MFDQQRQIEQMSGLLEVLRKADAGTLYLPWVQRALNPFPLASSGGVLCEQPQPWAVRILALYCAVFVVTTNSGIAFWTINLINDAGVVLGAVSTSALAPNTWSRLGASSGFTQPSSSNTNLEIQPVATGAPGAIYLLPALALLKTGN